MFRKKKGSSDHDTWLSNYERDAQESLGLRAREEFNVDKKSMRKNKVDVIVAIKRSL